MSLKTPKCLPANNRAYRPDNIYLQFGNNFSNYFSHKYVIYITRKVIYRASARFCCIEIHPRMVNKSHFKKCIFYIHWYISHSLFCILSLIMDLLYFLGIQNIQ